MSELVSGRENNTNVIVSTGPDVCLTPVGGGLVPVAYTSVAFAGDSTRVSPTVRDNGDPDLHLNSRIEKSTGHEPGVGAGVVVPGYQGEAFVETASPTVFTDGWATLRHRDPAMINRPGSGAVEPQFERTQYYERVKARIEARTPAEEIPMCLAPGAKPPELPICYAEELEQPMCSREVEPGTNESVESANGAAMLVTEAVAPPEEDNRRRPGETQDEYFERMLPKIRDQHRGEGIDPMDKVRELESIAEGITSDRDFYGWKQGIEPGRYHDPLGSDGVFHNELLSRTATGAPGDMDGLRPMMNPWDFVAADGNVYSHPGGVPAIQGERSSYVGQALATLDKQYAVWRERAGLPPQSEPLSSSTVKRARSEGKRLKKLGTAIRGGGSTGFVPDTAGIPTVTVPMGF